MYKLLYINLPLNIIKYLCNECSWSHFLIKKRNPIIQIHFTSHFVHLYYYKTLGLCLWVGGCVPYRLENHLMKLDILWHTVSLGFWQ